MQRLWKQVQRVQETLRTGSPADQDIAITALQDTLDASAAVLLPSSTYSQLQDVLRFYCRKVLPNLGLSEADQGWVQDRFEQTIHRLHAQEQIAKALEAQFKHLFLQLKSAAFESVEDVLSGITDIVYSPLEGGRGVFSPPGRGRGGFPKEIEKSYRTLQKSPFTAAHVLPFFETLISVTLSHVMLSGVEAGVEAGVEGTEDIIKEMFARINGLFWHQLNDFLQMKAVLVNTNTKTALLTRLDVTTALKSEGFDTLDFENTIDDRMYRSCWNAVQAARVFLEDQFPDSLKDRSFRVSCRFPNPTAGYNDTSASLLVGLKIIGDVLDLEIDPHTVVSGEMDESGKVLPVTGMAEKVLAAQQHSEIQRLFLPADGLFMTSRRVAIIGVRDLSEAIVRYYGEQFQKKLKQVSRRKILKGAMMLAAAPFAPFVFSAFRNIFSHPVLEHDWRLLECAKTLYQQNSDYHNATVILQAILERFQGEEAREVLRLKAFALGALGVIYLQQHQIDASLKAFHKASDLWRSMRDYENQADMVLRIGDVYRYTVAMDGMRQHSRSGLQYYQHARDLLRPSMKQFQKFQSVCCSSMGYLYYWSDEAQLAVQYCRKGVETIEEPETNWYYQTVKQYLGQALTKAGDYDHAQELLESTSQAKVLQSPYYQVKSCYALSEFYLTRGDVAQGVAFAGQADQLCRDYGLPGQQQILTRLLVRHGVSV